MSLTDTTYWIGVVTLPGVALVLYVASVIVRLLWELAGDWWTRWHPRLLDSNLERIAVAGSLVAARRFLVVALPFGRVLVYRSTRRPRRGELRPDPEQDAVYVATRGAVADALRQVKAKRHGTHAA